jgi:SAM-dependent methyltransferase
MSSWTSGYVAEIGYTHGFYRELTPALLSQIALAKGVRGPAASAPLAYCELGCGQGFSTNLLAAANPHVQMFATDFNPGHILNARALAAEAGTQNVQFFDQGFGDFADEPALPAFDMITLHGIYSWVTPEHRAQIVEFIRRKLKPGGLVYISYNSLPGWATGMPLRQLFAGHAETTSGPILPRIDDALAFVEKLAATNPAFFRANPSVGTRLDGIKKHDRRYLAHEYFNAEWNPFYYSDVARELDGAKLTFLGSANLLDDISEVNLTPEQSALLDGIGDPALRETVRDYIVNQQFRRDVFVKGRVEMTTWEVQDRWLDSRFALSAMRSEIPLKVNGARGEANLHEDVYAPILDALADGPRSLRQMMQTKALADRQVVATARALCVLMGAGRVDPCLDEAGDEARAESTRRFNTAVMKRARFSSDLSQLASPVTGGGVNVARFSQLFLLARQEGQKDPPQYVWDILAAQGQRLIKEGKVIEKADANLKELRSLFESFQRQQGLIDQLKVG